VNEPAAPQPIRVIVAALYPSVRAGLRALLDGPGGISVVGETAHLAVGSETSFAAADVLVVDLEHGGDAESLRAAAEALPLVLLGDGAADFAGFSLGDPIPRAYLLKDATSDELAAAVYAVAQGLTVANPALAARLTRPGASLLHGAVADATTHLTERELEVLRLVSAGLPNKGIALELGITDHTVKFHVGAILGKLGAASRTEAVTIAVRSGLLPL
jgi:DNA-binding NarL/FixJ family response regulator